MFVYRKWATITHKPGGNVSKLYKGVFLFGIVPLYISVIRQEPKNKYRK